MQEVVFDAYDDVALVMRNPDLAQALYDDGAVVMEGTLLVLHGADHHARRALEMRVFRRDFFHHYTHDVFPRTLEETIAPALAAGRADLIDLGYRVTMNLTADFAGIDRPRRSTDETEQLLRLVMSFSKGATLVHSTLDKDDVRREVRDALDEFDEAFLKPSIARRKAMLEGLRAGDLEEDALPRDVLTVLLRDEDRLELTADVLRREIAFYLQAGSHSTANATTHALDEILAWCRNRPGERQRMLNDSIYLQRCVHESFRLHPASPVAWRKPTQRLTLPGGKSVAIGDRVVLDLAAANRDAAKFGADAAAFNPHRALPTGILPFGLTFGTGAHSCLGRDLDGGVVPRGEALATHQLGIVPLFVLRLLALGARLDPDDPPTRDDDTHRPHWGRYPILFDPQQDHQR